MIRLTEEKLGPAARVLASSFWGEPIFCSMFLDEKTRDRFIRIYMETSVRLAVAYADAYTTSEKIEGVLIGSRSTMPETVRLKMQSEWPEPKRTYGEDLSRRVISLNKRMEEVRVRNLSGDYLYMWMLGVDPALQGKGYGSSLLKEVLQRIDSERLSCYLETHSERNARLYERHGFVIAEDLFLPEANIRHWAMVRAAR